MDVNTDESLALQNLCAALRSNDPTITSVRTHGIPNGSGRQLGESLRCNTTVSTIAFESAQRYLEPDDLDREGNAASHPLLDWIRTSNVLDTVDVCDHGTLNIHVYEAIAVNATIAVYLRKSYPSYDPLAVLLRTTRSIRRLFVVFYDSPPLEINDDDWHVPSAFGANSTIAELTIGSDSEQEADITSILRELGPHPMLKELRVGLPSRTLVAHCLALTDLLRSSQTLRSLSLFMITFDEVAMNVILDALRSNQLLNHFAMENCTMDDDALSAMVTFMQSTANAGTNMLKELQLKCVADAPLNGRQRLGSPYPMAATMLIGSSLEEFCLNGASEDVDMIGFLSGLVANVSHIRLRRLLLVQALGAAEFQVLAEFLRQTHQLEYLALSSDNDPQLLVSAIRQNGSLTNVAFFGESPLNQAQLRLLQAFCLRNRKTRKLLAKPSLPLSSNGSTGETETANGPATTTKTTDLTVFPELFGSSLIAPRTAPCAMLIGLLGTIDRTGHGVGAKRSASTDAL